MAQRVVTSSTYTRITIKPMCTVSTRAPTQQHTPAVKPPTCCHAPHCPSFLPLRAPMSPQVKVSRLDLPQSGLGVLSRLVCRNADYSRITVHFRLLPLEASRPLVDVPYRLHKDGGALPGSPVFELQPEHCNYEVVLDVVQGREVLARCGGSESCCGVKGGVVGRGVRGVEGAREGCCRVTGLQEARRGVLGQCLWFREVQRVQEGCGESRGGGRGACEQSQRGCVWAPGMYVRPSFHQARYKTGQEQDRQDRAAQQLGVRAQL